MAFDRGRARGPAEDGARDLMGLDLAPGAARGAKPESRQGAGVAQPECGADIGDDQVERPVGVGIEVGERSGRRGGIGVVERLEHQLAARALAGGRAERADPIQHPGDHAMVVDAEPAAAGLQVQAGNHVGAIRPVPAGRARRAARQLVAVGGDQERPCRLGPPHQNQSAHRRVGLRPAGLFVIVPLYCRGYRSDRPCEVS